VNPPTAPTTPGHGTEGLNGKQLITTPGGLASTGTDALGLAALALLMLMMGALAMLAGTRRREV